MTALESTDDPLIAELIDAAHVAKSAHSVRLDFEECNTCLGLWLDLVEQGQARNPERWDTEPRIANTASALLKASLLGYWRGIDSNKDSPRAALPLDKLTKDKVFTEAHSRLKVYRHNSVAHHGSDDTQNWRWHVDKVVLSISDQGRVGALYPWQRMRSARQIAHDLAAVLLRIDPVLSDWSTKCQKRLLGKVRRVNGRGLLPQVLTTPFEPLSFFTNDTLGQNKQFWTAAEQVVSDEGLWEQLRPAPGNLFRGN